MTPQDISRLRLCNTGLTGSPFVSPAEAVSHSGAVQAQDFSAAAWSLGLRIRDATRDTIEQAFNDGKILRTHVMRPTWHFVMPEDIRWMLGLTASRVKAVLSHYDRKLGFDEALYARSNAAIVRALEGRSYRTRQELKGVLADAGIATDVQKLGHILVRAELDGLACSGPLRGKQFTYALLDDRVPQSGERTREESLDLLARRYFTSHGPAQLRDFSWWSGLSGKDSLAALDRIRPDFEESAQGGKTYWSSPDAGTKNPPAPAALLLSIYDEYSIAYQDRSAISDKRDIERMIAAGNALTGIIVLDGRVAGSWRKATKNSYIEIRLSPFRPLDENEREAVEREVSRYGRFVGLPAGIVEEG